MRPDTIRVFGKKHFESRSQYGLKFCEVFAIADAIRIFGKQNLESRSQYGLKFCDISSTGKKSWQKIAQNLIFRRGARRKCLSLFKWVCAARKIKSGF